MGVLFGPWILMSHVSGVNRVKSRTELKWPRETILPLRLFAHTAAELSQSSLKLAICRNLWLPFLPQGTVDPEVDILSLPLLLSKTTIRSPGKWPDNQGKSPLPCKQASSCFRKTGSKSGPWEREKGRRTKEMVSLWALSGEDVL